MDLKNQRNGAKSAPEAAKSERRDFSDQGVRFLAG